MKRCQKCGATKPLDGFHRHSKKPDGHHDRCKDCLSEYAREWYHRNKERAQANNRRWKEANPIRIRELSVLKQYGMSHDDFERLLDSQGRRCAICRTKDPRGQGSFHVDHDHATGKVRGLLCNNCNRGLGQFADRPELLRAAALYLEDAECASLPWSLAPISP